MKYQDYLQKKSPAKINENLQAINEAEDSIGASFLKFFQSMKSYAAMQSAWPKLYQEKQDLAVEKIVGAAKFDAQSSEIKLDKIEKMEAQLKAQKEKLPREKRVEFDQKMKEKLKLYTSTLDEKMKAKKKDYEARMDAKIKEIGADIDELSKKNPIESDILSKQWEAEQTEMTLDMDAKSEDDRINQLAALGEEAYSDEKIAKMKQRGKERLAAERAAAEEKISDLEKEADAKQAELDDKLAKASDDQKEAIGKIKQFQADLKDYIAKAKAAKAAANESLKLENYLNFDIFEEEGGEDKSKKAKQDALQAQKKAQASLDSISAGTIKKGLGLDPEDADEFVVNLKGQLKDAKDELKVSDTEKIEVSADDDDTTTTKTEPEATDDKDQKKEELKGKIEDKKAAIKQAQQDEKPQEEIDAMIDDLNALKQQMEDLGESVKHIDEFLKEFNSPASTVATPKIMKFADFMASR